MDQPLPSSLNNQPPLPKRKHHLILVALAAIAGVGYIAFNIWVYRYATSGRAPKTFQGLTLPKQGETFSETPSLASPDIPRPTGPGEFACSPDGTCNRYGEDIRNQYCPTTFADSQCLNSCGNTAKRCSK